MAQSSPSRRSRTDPRAGSAAALGGASGGAGRNGGFDTVSASWRERRQSSIRGGEVHKPVVAAFEDRVFVAFNEDARHKQVFLVTSENGGRSFGEIVQVSNADPAKGRGHSPAIVVDPDGRIHICWIDNSILGSDEGLLYYTSSSNGLKFSSKKLIYALLPN